MSLKAMTSAYEVEIYVRAREHFGEEHQLRKSAEECCELATAIMRFTNSCDGHTAQECLDNILEEMADVDIMLNQMWGIFGGMKNSDGETVGDIRTRKLHRLLCRIDEEQDDEEARTSGIDDQ